MVFKRAVYIVAARRTPFGTYGGKLKDFSATQLQELANRAALKQAKLSPEAVDSTVVGNVMQTSSDAAYIARHAALRAGVPIHVPALTVNRLCGSGFQAIISGGQEIQLGDSEVVLCGGAESMSQAPYAVRNTRFGTKLGQDLKLEDTLWQGLTDEYAKTPMGITGNRSRGKTEPFRRCSSSGEPGEEVQRQPARHRSVRAAVAATLEESERARFVQG